MESRKPKAVFFLLPLSKGFAWRRMSNATSFILTSSLKSMEKWGKFPLSWEMVSFVKGRRQCELITRIWNLKSKETWGKFPLSWGKGQLCNKKGEEDEENVISPPQFETIMGQTKGAQPHVSCKLPNCHPNWFEPGVCLILGKGPSFHF